MSVVAACSNDKAGREVPAIHAEEPAAAAEAPPETQPATEATSGGGQRYRVLAGTAYFYASPQQAKPTGQYLLRGDVLYGQDAGNGFVKTQFVNPRGATVTGWLKAEELGRLSAAAAARPSVPARPAPARPTAPVTAPAEVAAAPVASAPPAARPASGSATAVVQVARAYFYNSPDLIQPRKAYCEQGDKVRLGQEQDEAVYVTFTNWEKVTTRGWMKKDDLRFAR